MAEFLAWFILLFPFFAVAIYTAKGFIDEYRENRK